MWLYALDTSGGLAVAARAGRGFFNQLALYILGLRSDFGLDSPRVSGLTQSLASVVTFALIVESARLASRGMLCIRAMPIAFQCHLTVAMQTASQAIVLALSL
jgi:hypothetical protein